MGREYKQASLYQSQGGTLWAQKERTGHSSQIHPEKELKEKKAADMKDLSAPLLLSGVQRSLKDLRQIEVKEETQVAKYGDGLLDSERISSC